MKKATFASSDFDRTIWQTRREHLVAEKKVRVRQTARLPVIKQLCATIAPRDRLPVCFVTMLRKQLVQYGYVLPD